MFTIVAERIDHTRKAICEATENREVTCKGLDGAVVGLEDMTVIRGELLD